MSSLPALALEAVPGSEDEWTEEELPTLAVVINAAVAWLESGLGPPARVDELLRLQTSPSLGPLALADRLGLDRCEQALRELHRTTGQPAHRPCRLLRTMVRAGLLGRKTGSGFYEYPDPRDRTAPSMLHALLASPGEPSARCDRGGRAFTVGVRQDTPAAREALCDFYDRFAPKGIAQGLPPRLPHLRREWVDLLFEKGINLFATRGSELLGHAALVDQAPGVSCEYVVFVHQAQQGRGIGTELTESAKEVARGLGYPQVWLTVEAWNAAALRVYEKVGFRLHGPRSEELEMVLDLSPDRHYLGGPGRWAP